LVKPTALIYEPLEYLAQIGSRYPCRGAMPMLFVVTTPT
jgi:hypothetical protein